MVFSAGLLKDANHVGQPVLYAVHVRCRSNIVADDPSLASILFLHLLVVNANLRYTPGRDGLGHHFQLFPLVQPHPDHVQVL